MTNQLKMKQLLKSIGEAILTHQQAIKTQRLRQHLSPGDFVSIIHAVSSQDVLADIHRRYQGVVLNVSIYSDGSSEAEVYLESLWKIVKVSSDRILLPKEVN